MVSIDDYFAAMKIVDAFDSEVLEIGKSLIQRINDAWFIAFGKKYSYADEYVDSVTVEGSEISLTGYNWKADDPEYFSFPIYLLDEHANVDAYVTELINEEKKRREFEAVKLQQHLEKQKYELSLKTVKMEPAEYQKYQEWKQNNLTS